VACAGLAALCAMVCDTAKSPPLATTEPIVADPKSVTGGGQPKVLVCHRTGNGRYHQINIAAPAVPAHLVHGDCLVDDGDPLTEDTCDPDLGCTHVRLIRGPVQSSPIALSCSNQILVNVNSDSDSISVFDATTTVSHRLGEVPVGREPVSVTLCDSRTAYVANARDGTISVVDLFARSVVDTIAVGAEPMAVALSPNASRLYVANSASNSLTVINTTTLGVVAVVDLSAFGTAPRAIAVTSDGDADDTDETVFVALFYAQLRPGKTSVDEGQDDQREGRVVAISAATNTVLGAPNPIALGPIANTGFNSNGKLAPAAPGPVPFVPSTNPQTFTTPTGAFPNQLAAIAIHPTAAKAYVVSTGASPNGPLRFNSMNQGLVSVFDAATRLCLKTANEDIFGSSPTVACHDS
jgi:YVTN family beta-propeller protein